MAKGNTALRNGLGFLNLLFAIFGVMFIAFAIYAHVHITDVEEFKNMIGIIVCYVFGSITLFVSFLGAYGAFREVRWMLNVFLILMWTGFLCLIRATVTVASKKPEVSKDLQDKMYKISLDETSESLKEMINKIQLSMHCCGLSDGYTDWNEHVPKSCNCIPKEEATSDVCVSLERLFSHHVEIKRMVYKQPCGPIIVKFTQTVFDVVTGLLSVLTVLTVLGIATSSSMISHLKINRSAGVVQTPAWTFSTGPPKYNELVKEPYPSSL